MILHVEIEQEIDGRWLAEVTDLPGVMAYGVSRPGAGTRPPFPSGAPGARRRPSASSPPFAGGAGSLGRPRRRNARR